MPQVHPEVQAVIDRVKKEVPNLRSSDLSIAESRALRAKPQPSWLRLASREMAKVEDRTIPGPAGPLSVRIYTPKTGPEGARPVLLFFHTGAFVFGNLDTEDPHCRCIADESGCLVVSVDYRLAPENKFPAAHDDAIAAWNWVSTHAKEIGGDAKRFAVAGGSAGANLTAGVCRYARDQGGPAIALQIAFVGGFNVYPPVPSHALRSMGASGAGYASMVSDAYRNSDDDRRNVRYAPLIATEYRNLPPALIVVAECDGFCDEGKLYADKLRSAGVAVDLYIAKGQVHQVFSWAGAFSEGPRVLDRAATALRRVMEVPALAAR